MKLACQELSETTCEFVAEGATPEETAQIMLAHARVDHEKDIEMLTDEEVMQQFTAKVHN